MFKALGSSRLTSYLGRFENLQGRLPAIDWKRSFWSSKVFLSMCPPIRGQFIFRACRLWYACLPGADGCFRRGGGHDSSRSPAFHAEALVPGAAARFRRGAGARRVGSRDAECARFLCALEHDDAADAE